MHSQPFIWHGSGLHGAGAGIAAVMHGTESAFKVKTLAREIDMASSYCNTRMQEGVILPIAGLKLVV